MKNVSRKLALVLGMAPALLAGAAQAAQDYGNNDSYRDGVYDSRSGYNDNAYGRGSSYYGRDDRYAYSDRGNRRYVRCESTDRRTVICSVDTTGGVRLVQQLSDRSCVRGRNWGANQQGIWVTDGCRARFEVNDAGVGYGAVYGGVTGGSYATSRAVRCESRNGRTVFCGPNFGRRVRLVNQLSDTACVRGRNWGTNRGELWVSRGCRGEFVIGNGGAYGSNYGSNYRY